MRGSRFALAAALALGGLGVSNALTGCKDSPAANAPAPPAPSAEPEQHQVAYSPFVVRVEGEAPFQIISFKQVGSVDPEAAPAVFETLAESVALELGRLETSMSLSIDYSPAAAAPETHLACGAAQIYVDFWRASSPEGWGFSLWSGCSEDAQFAWREVASPPQTDLTKEFEPIARQIAQALHHAKSTGCVRKAC